MFRLMSRAPLLVKTLLAYKRGLTCVNYPPLYLWIEPTDYCNLDCSVCPSQKPKVRSKGKMEFSLFKKIIDEAAIGFPIINLYLAGESLLHPQIFDMINYAADHNAATCLFTNATLLDTSTAHRLLDSKLDWLGFSVDGYDQQTYDMIRRKASFATTIANIETFLALKQQRGLKHPHTYLNLVETPCLLQDTPKNNQHTFKQRFFDLGLQQFVVSQPHNWAGLINNADMLDSPTSASRNTIPTKTASHYARCPSPWSTLAVLWDGVVVPCCLDAHARYAIGNVRTHSVIEIFNNSRMQSLRKQMTNGNIGDVELCRNCSVLDDKAYFGLSKRIWIELRDNVTAALSKFI